MNGETRMLVIRSLSSEFVFVRRALPMGMKGVTIKNGVVSPGDAELKQLVARYGPAAKPGDRAQITNVEIKDRSIRFEINGGPKKKQKWYQHIQVGINNASIQKQEDPNKAPHGTYVELEFDKFVPEMTGDQVRELLSPVFDFHAKSAAEAYLETIPPIAKQAIKNHQVLVGMNREMVTAAKGKPDKKVRERDGATEYEEWLYGQPPQEVQFVRFVGDEVVRLEIMKVDGEKVVRTEKQVDLGASQPSLAEKQEPPKPRPTNAPTLRRPGEAPPDNTPVPAAGTGMPLPPPPDRPSPPSK
jgi:hypothetical protein